MKKVVWKVGEEVQKKQDEVYPITCPYCFKKVGPEEIVFRADHSVPQDPQYALQEDKVLNQYRKSRGLNKLGNMEAIVYPERIYEENKKQVNGMVLQCIDKYGVVTTKRLCPHCHNKLPFFLGRGPSCIISIVGASKVGKSTYMAAMLYTLQRYIAKDFNWICASDSASKRLLQEYEELLFNQEKREARGQTEEQPLEVQPLIMYIKDEAGNKPPMTIAFYDIPSKAMESQEYMEIYGESVQHSDGILFLVDPMQFKELREKKIEQHDGLLEKALLAENATEDPRDSIIHLYENFISLQSGDKTNIPTAVVMTKSDILKNISCGYVDKSSQIFYQSVHKNFFDLNQWGEVEEKVKKLIDDIDRIFKDGMDMYFSNLAYFAVSQKFAQPLRIEEPLLWILYQLKYVDGRKETNDSAAVLY